MAPLKTWVWCLLCASRILELPSVSALITSRFHCPFTELAVNQHALVRCPGQQQVWLDGPRHWWVRALWLPLIKWCWSTTACPSLLTNKRSASSHRALHLAHLRHSINDYRSKFNWNLPMVHSKRSQNGSVCHPCLGCSGNNLWRIHPMPIRGISMRQEEQRLRISRLHWRQPQRGTWGRQLAATAHSMSELGAPSETWPTDARREETKVQGR